MKCYTFWVRETKKIRIAGELKQITLVAGSNVSKDDAASNADRMASAIEERIQNRKQKRESYEAAIKEHVAGEINPKNIITINRYGAQVLNTTEYTILDIDRAPRSLMDWFRRDKRDAKDKIVDHFKRRAARYPELGAAFRIYETRNGVRIVGKTYFCPQTKRFHGVMRAMRVDKLYALLCRKQDCYRARLTPKPYRMKMETMRIKTPLDCETEAYNIWREKYAAASGNYSVVKLRETLGMDFSGDPVIVLHDKITRLDAKALLA